MKVVFWAVPVLAVASCFVGCAEAGELGDKVLPFVEEVRMLADIRNKRERDRLQIELNETRYRETTRALSFLTASFDKQVEELIATKEPSTRDLFLQVLEAQGDTERVELLKRAMAKRNRPRSRASQSKGKRSRSRSSSRKGVPVKGVWDFLDRTNLDRNEKRDVLVFLEETGRGALGKELLKSLDDGTREHIQTDLRRMGNPLERQSSSSRSKKSPEELTDLLKKFDSEDALEVAFEFLAPEEQENIMRLSPKDFKKPGTVIPHLQLADVPFEAVVKVGKLTSSEKLEFFKYLKKTGRVAIREGLLNSIDEADRDFFDEQLNELEPFSGEPSERQRSKISPEELMAELKELGKKVSKVAFEFLTPEEKDSLRAVGYQEG